VLIETIRAGRASTQAFFLSAPARRWESGYRGFDRSRRREIGWWGTPNTFRAKAPGSKFCFWCSQDYRL